MAITTLLFDLDETLVADQAATLAALHTTCQLVAERAGTDAQRMSAVVWQLGERLWAEAPTRAYCQSLGISAWEGLWGRFAGNDPHVVALATFAHHYQFEVWRLAFAEQGLQDHAYCEEMMASFLATRRATHQVFPETVAVLQQLRGRYRLGLVTNGASDLQREKIAGAALEPYFDAIVVSGDVGVGKPDAKVFRRALDLLHAHPEETAMVGDNIIRDIQGAMALGIRGIWVCREKAPDRLPITPDATITALNEVERWL